MLLLVFTLGMTAPAFDPALEPFVRALKAAVGSAQQAPVFDNRSIRKLPDFSGRDADWPLWCFVFEAHLACLSDDDVLAQALAETADPLLSGMSAAWKILAKKIYILLVTGVKGKALGLLRGVEKFNGFSCWRVLKRHYEPDIAGRHAGMLVGLLSPDWQQRVDSGFDFLEVLTSW